MNSSDISTSSIHETEEGPAAEKPARRLLGGMARWILPVLIILGVIGAWQGAVLLFEVPEWKLPAPDDIGSELLNSRSLFLEHTLVTLKEVVVGFAIALGFGVVLAAAIAYSQTLQRAIYPFVIASQTVPIIVIAPLLLIWVGYGLTPKVIVVVLIAFFPIVVNTVDGLRSADPDMVNMLRTFGASRWRIFSKLQVPSALPLFFSGTKIAITFSVIGAVIGEWVGASAGLGYLTRLSVPLFLTARSFGAVAILAFMGISLFVIVTALERYFLSWYYTEKRQRALGER